MEDSGVFFRGFLYQRYRHQPGLEPAGAAAGACADHPNAPMAAVAAVSHIYRESPGECGMTTGPREQKTILLFANTAWYLYNFRLKLAKDLRGEGYRVVLASPYDEYAGRIREEGFEWVEIQISRKGVNPLREIAGFLRVLKAYRCVQPDLCHHFTIKPALFGSTAARLLGVKAVVNAITGLGYLFMHPGLKNSITRRFVFPFFRFALHHPNSVVIFQNKADQNEYHKAGLIRIEDSVIIPGSGVDPSQFPSHHTFPDKPQIALIARMLRDKGIEEYVEAIRILRARGYNGRALLVGGLDDGNPSAISQDEILQWECEGVIQWLDHQDDIPSILAASCVVVLPSYREGLSRVLVEAAAAGRPIVATDVPGCREIVQHGVNGFLVPLKNVEKLAESISILLRDRDLAERYGQAGRELVIHHFSSWIINARTIDFYTKLLK